MLKNTDVKEMKDAIDGLEATHRIDEIEDKKDYSQKEFEEFVSKSGAAGSFMIFRSEEKDTELGIDQL